MEKKLFISNVVEEEKASFEHEESDLFTEDFLKKVFEFQEYSCDICKADFSEEHDKESLLVGHLVIPTSKGGEVVLENTKALCSGCYDLVHEVSEMPKREKIKLKKSFKKKLWKLKGRSCQRCGLVLQTGGGTLAIHPFQPAGWDRGF